MKALLCTAFGPLEHLAVREIQSPRPGPQQVLIHVKAASLNFPDALMAQGLYQVSPPLPFSPGLPSGKGQSRHIAGSLTRPAFRVIESSTHGRRDARTSIPMSRRRLSWTP
jgi:NADPH2:quinone reductase